MKLEQCEFFTKFLEICDLCYKNGWNERNGGNMSYHLKPEEVDLIRDELDENTQWSDIGTEVESLKNEYFMFTGSGKFFRNTKSKPEENTCIIRLNNDGTKYKIVWGLTNGGRPTSELPTHLMNHEVKFKATDGKFRVILHAHPANIIALTYVLPKDSSVFTTEIWDTMTECPIVFPHGIGVIDWMVPGGREIAVKTAEMIKKYDIVVWCYHGAFVSGDDFDNAYGLLETVEKAAEILVKIKSMGGKQYHLSEDDIMSLAPAYDVDINRELIAKL